jgi:hypothetical protein
VDRAHVDLDDDRDTHRVVALTRSDSALQEELRVIDDRIETYRRFERRTP